MPVYTNNLTRPALLIFQALLILITTTDSLSAQGNSDLFVGPFVPVQEEHPQPPRSSPLITGFQYGLPSAAPPPPPPAREAAPVRQGPRDIFYSPSLGRYSVGGVEFDEEEYDVALQSVNFLDRPGSPQTPAPDWRRLRGDQYGRYLQSISEGGDPARPVDQTIYNNCVIARSRGTSESVLREVRASCRETAKNPSMLDRWRWGD